MSITAIEAIKDFLKRENDGVSVAEIKQRIAVFVKDREERHAANPRAFTRTEYSESRQRWVVREGKKLMRDKLNEV